MLTLSLVQTQMAYVIVALSIFLVQYTIFPNGIVYYTSI